MEASDEQRQTYPLEDNTEKEKSATVAITIDFQSYLQTLMINVGFGVAERAVYNPTFLHFMQVALLASAQKLHSFKKNTSQKTTEEEQNHLNWLKTQSNSEEDEEKIAHALELFNEEQQHYLSNIMINAGYHTSETEESHNSYISYFSCFLTSETKKLTRYKSRFESPKIKSDSPKITMVVKFEDFQVSLSSLKLIATTKKHCLYRVSTPVGYRVLKVLKSKSPRTKDIENLVKELTVLSNVEHHAFRQSFARTTYRNRHAILLEWIDGYSVSDISDARTFSVLDFLAIAKDLVSSLIAMHTKKNMLMNLTCEHVIIMNRGTACPSVKIISCGSSVSSSREKNYISNGDLLAMDLRHISPEQMGRTGNKFIDFRSDFYSLGIIFYKLLSKRFPFDHANASKLISLHILYDPPPISNIPVPISDMLSKLMRKNPDERYQSAKGILHDLYLMTSEYSSDNSLKSISLMQHDISETFILPQKLYGRSAEYSALLSVFTKATPDSFQTLFVTGESGSGKSSLVLELYKPVAMKDGIFLSGNCSKSKPYSVLIEAIDNFCNNLLLEDNTTVANYRSLIQDAVGEEGKILTDIIPNLHLIIGPQPIIADAFGNQAKHRFDYVFIKFIKSICSLNLPFVLVLEDLQWIDLASFDLLSSVIKDSIKNLMLIGVYRDDEVNDAHPVTHLLQEIKKVNVNMTEIKLNNMDPETVNELISDALCVSPLETYTLTAVVHEKTEGSPFFVKQMLNSLFEQSLITFCYGERKWQWDVRTFGEKHDVAGNVLELLRHKILSLDKKTQQALKVASCLGGSFSFSTLKLIVNCSKGIEDALNKGMICKGSDNMYRFVHAQIQQAVTSLLPKENRNKLYLYIGKKLWNLISCEVLNEDLFTVVNLLQHTVDIVYDAEERLKMAELFMQVGKKAMTSTAFKQAFKYLDTGIKLLCSNSWKSSYDLSLKLHNHAAKAAYSIAHYSNMNTFLDTISDNATSALHLVQSYSIQIKCFNDRRMYKEAIQKGLYILDKIGESKLCTNIRSFSEDDSIIASEIHTAKCLLNRISNEDFLDMKEMVDETLLAVMLLVSDIMISCFMSTPQLVPLLASRMIQITFKDGISKYSSLAFVQFGAFICCRGDTTNGYQIGNYALSLLHKMRVKELFPVVNTSYYHLVLPYNASVHLSHAPLLQSYRVGLEVGALDISTLSANGYCLCAFISGKYLESLADDVEKLNERLPIKTMGFLSVRQAVLNLRSEGSNPEKNPAVLMGEEFDCYTCFDENLAPGDVSRCTIQCFIVAYLFYDYPLALRFLERCRPIKNYILSSYQYPIFLFYDGLVSLAIARNDSEGKDKDKMILQAEESISKLKDMSEVIPDNFLNKVYLLQAEMQVVLCNYSEALPHYKKAISLSKKYGFVHEEALACERAGILYLHQNLVDSAYQFLLQSYYSYECWGAISKMEHLVKKYPLLSDKIKESKSKLKCSKIPRVQLQLDEHSQASVSLLTNGSFCTFSSSYLQRKRVRFS